MKDRLCAYKAADLSMFNILVSALKIRLFSELTIVPNTLFYSLRKKREINFLIKIKYYLLFFFQ